MTGKDLTFSHTALTGRQLCATRPKCMAHGLNASSTDITGVQPGIYFATVFTAATKTVSRVIISAKA